MMVDHDRVEAKLFRFGERLDARHATINSNQQFRTALGERSDRVDIGPISLEDTIRDVNDRIQPATTQIVAQQR